MTSEFGQNHGDRADIVQHFESPFIVVGFFTPDYVTAASDFASNLVEQRISHHLYERSKIEGGWAAQTRQKPSVLVAARNDYPQDILILMDVDCRVRGDIKGILNSPGDVALRMKRTAVGARQALKPCTRVMLLRPTRGSAAFVGAWQAACDTSISGSAESVLMRSMSDSPKYYSVGTMSLRYAGMELHDAPSDALIVHDSIRDPTRPAWTARRRLQKYFRASRDAVFRLATGKTYKENFPSRGGGRIGQSERTDHNDPSRSRRCGVESPNKLKLVLPSRETSVMKCAAWARSSMVRADGS